MLASMAAATFVAALAKPLVGRAAATSDKADSTAPVRWVPGMELYTLGLKPTDDIAGAFKALAAIGYREVEFSGPYDRTAAELRRALDAAGLTGPAAHALPRPAKGAWDLGDASKFAADLHTLGASYGVVPIPLLPDRIYEVLQHPPAGFDMQASSRLFSTLELDDWKRTADFLNEKAIALAKDGFRLAYHNHGMDFASLPGDTNGFRVLVERTDPKLVDFELDIGWAVSAGQELPPLFRQLGDRLKLLHLKDTKRLATSVQDLASTDAGTGIVKWNELVDLVRHSSIQHMFVEQEEPFPTTPMDAARIDYEFLTKLFAGKAAASPRAKT
jgi:sugar phosphate isomerase/epimerase